MGKYYTTIMGNEQNCFLTVFHKKWREEILSHKMPYSNSAQILKGNRLRPILMAWGYYSNDPAINHEYIVEFAICIELIHKASILLDDLIDQDTLRHGKNTFHIEYSKEEAILYAIYLINRSVSIMYEKDISLVNSYTPILLETISSMTKGAIKEVGSYELTDIQNILEIINLETSSLIKNSFTLGYKLSKTNFMDISSTISNIGQLCGLCFQELNDLEPFLAPDINVQYKGALNLDFEKSRKNLVMATLYGACTTKEKAILRTKMDKNFLFQLISKYQILDTFLEIIKKQMFSIKEMIFSIENTNPIFYSDFKDFLDNMFNFCFQKCNLNFEKNFFKNR